MDLYKSLKYCLQKKGSKAAFEKHSLRPQKHGYRLLAAFPMAAFITRPKVRSSKPIAAFFENAAKTRPIAAFTKNAARGQL